MSIEEGVEFLRDTPYPVTRRKLADLLKGADRARLGHRYVYQTADIVERHRDHYCPANRQPTPQS